MSMPQKDDAKWRKILLRGNEGAPSLTQRALAEVLRLHSAGIAFADAFCARFPTTSHLGWAESWAFAEKELGIETPAEAKQSSDAITLFLDDEGYTRLEGESVAARTIRIIQEAEQRAAATSPLVRRGE